MKNAKERRKNSCGYKWFDSPKTLPLWSRGSPYNFTKICESCKAVWSRQTSRLNPSLGFVLPEAMRELLGASAGLSSSSTLGSPYPQPAPCQHPEHNTWGTIWSQVFMKRSRASWVREGGGEATSKAKPKNFREWIQYLTSEVPRLFCWVWVVVQWQNGLSCTGLRSIHLPRSSPSIWIPVLSWDPGQALGLQYFFFYNTLMEI